MAPENFNPDYLIPGTHIGAYVVRTMLGQGRSGSVYEVESAEGHRFALKLCRYHGGGYGTSEWRMDQRYSRSISCQELLKGQRNVAELYAHGRYPDPSRGHQYLVHELVPGGLHITEWVKRESPTLRKLVGAFVELAELCGVMASKGICHRDLKPANILVTPEGTPKVIDFESATFPHATFVTRREASEVPGTRGWQCPELCQAILEEQSNEKSKEAFVFHPWGDLFSLGVVLYECLLGEHPFDTSLPHRLLLAEIAYEAPFHPMQLSTAVPLGLDKLVMKLLEKQPEARYRDGAEVADALRKLLENAKDERWGRPFKQPVPDEEDAPVLPLLFALVPPQTPVPANGKESEGPMPDAPPSEPHSLDSGASADAEKSREAPVSAKPDASPPHSAHPGEVPFDEFETNEPRGTPESGPPAVGTVLDFGEAGAYTLERCLGRGGMGEVYLARQKGAAGFVQLVAVKRVRPGKRWEERRFVDEARVLSRLRHSNIARVYAFHQWQGSYYLVMEYVEGHSLHALLELARRKRYRFSESVACAIMAEVAAALHYAHQAKDDASRPLSIVHRDVSPTNILIDNTGRVVLVDFGVAFNKQEGRITTSASSKAIKGKWPYVSPEQAKRLPLDGRSDLFSVGIILAELLTGKLLFGWDDLTLDRIREVTPEYVASHLPGVSKPLRAIFQRLLANNPDERFPNGDEAAKALRRHARLYEAPQSIRAEVEKLQAQPDVKVLPAAALAAARSLSKVKRARRAVALAGAAALAALTFVSWYVPRHSGSVPASPPLQGPAVSWSRPPVETITPAPPVLPLLDDPHEGKPKREEAAAVAAGPAHRRKASDKHSAPTVVKVDKKAHIRLTAPPAGRPTDGAVHGSPDSDEASGTLRRELAAAQSQLAVMTENYVRLSGEVTSPEHTIAEVLAANNADLIQFRLVSFRSFKSNEVRAEMAIYLPKNESDSSSVGVVFDITNPNEAAPWAPTEAAVIPDPKLPERMALVATRAVPRVIAPGQHGRVAMVFSREVYGPKEGEGPAPTVVQLALLRDDRPEVSFEVMTADLQTQSPDPFLRRLWPF